MTSSNPYAGKTTAQVYNDPSPTLDLNVSDDTRHQEMPTASLDTKSPPTGTINEVLKWVGQDPTRAQQALDLELKSERPRPRLVKALGDRA